MNIRQSIISTKSNTVYHESKTSSELVIIDDLGVLSVIVTNNCWNPFLLWKTRLSRGFQTSEHYWERDALLWEGVSRTENNRPTHLYFFVWVQPNFWVGDLLDVNDISKLNIDNQMFDIEQKTRWFGQMSKRGCCCFSASNTESTHLMKLHLYGGLCYLYRAI